MNTNQERLVRIVLNGQKSGNEDFRAAVETLREEGHRIEVRLTWEPGDETWSARDAVRDGVDVLVAAGGDGTVNGVLNGVIDATEDAKSGEAGAPAIAVIPMGTANDFAVGCELPMDDIEAALRLAATGASFPVDVGCINDHAFFNAAAAGLGAQITSETPVALKKLMGGAAYAVMGVLRIPELQPFPTRFEVGGLKNEFEILLLTIGNGRNTAGGQIIAPDAKLDDGLLDVMVVHDAEPTEWLAMFDEYDNLGKDDCQYVRYQQLKSFTVEFDEEVQMNLDGEPITNSRFEVSLLPKRVRLVLPEGCGLLTGNPWTPDE